MPIRRLLALAALVLATCSGCATHPAPSNAPPLLLVSIDGLRPADITAEEMPVLHALGQAGVRADGMRPSFPSLTFPNHYAMVTGLRPDRHGIVHNSMQDPALGRFRTSLRDAVTRADWWGGTPVWVSAERAGLRTAITSWPGSEAPIHALQASEWHPYEEGRSAEANAALVASWFEAPVATRPRLAALYFDQVDDPSHTYGPDSPQAREARRQVDAAIGRLLDRLRRDGLLLQTNVVVVSDHGFETVRPGQIIRTTDMAPAEVAEAVSDGQVISFAPHAGKHAEAERALLGRHAHYECWRKQDLPARWHYGTHPRIPAIICQMDPGWDALWPQKADWHFRNRPHATRGSHGYDPDLPQMRASFIASGPDFRPATHLPVFENVDVYPLLMRLLRLPAEPNDGDIAPLLPALRETR